MAVVYILYSPKIDKYYTGSCKDLGERMSSHKTKAYSDAFTARADDWELYLCLEDLGYEQCRKIEQHIKRMKSRKYIENLKKYTDLRNKLIAKYQ